MVIYCNSEGKIYGTAQGKLLSACPVIEAPPEEPPPEYITIPDEGDGVPVVDFDPTPIPGCDPDIPKPVLNAIRMGPFWIQIVFEDSDPAIEVELCVDGGAWTAGNEFRYTEEGESLFYVNAVGTAGVEMEIKVRAVVDGSCGPHISVTGTPDYRAPSTPTLESISYTSIADYSGAPGADNYSVDFAIALYYLGGFQENQLTVQLQFVQQDWQDASETRTTSWADSLTFDKQKDSIVLNRYNFKFDGAWETTQVNVRVRTPNNASSPFIGESPELAIPLTWPT